MEKILEKNRQVNFKTNSEVLEQAKVVFSESNMDLTTALNAFLEVVALKKKIPFETAEELEKERLLADLQAEMQKSWESIEAGRGLSLEEARKKLWHTK